jgi:hypothetical protein
MLNRSAYEANISELQKKFNTYLKISFVKRYDLDFLEEKDYFFAFRLFSYCVQNDIETKYFKFGLKQCIETDIRDLPSARFIIDTKRKFDESSYVV